MKIIILLLAVALYSCSNNSAQRKIYEDSARMYLDSVVKYKPTGFPDTIYGETIRRGRYDMYEIMYRHYKGEAEKLK